MNNTETKVTALLSSIVNFKRTIEDGEDIIVEYVELKGLFDSFPMKTIRLKLAKGIEQFEKYFNKKAEHYETGSILWASLDGFGLVVSQKEEE